eukprot:3940231-Rhodomonas_salina.1
MAYGSRPRSWIRRTSLSTHPYAPVLCPYAPVLCPDAPTQCPLRHLPPSTHGTRSSEAADTYTQTHVDTNRQIHRHRRVYLWAPTLVDDSMLVAVTTGRLLADGGRNGRLLSYGGSTSNGRLLAYGGVRRAYEHSVYCDTLTRLTSRMLLQMMSRMSPYNTSLVQPPLPTPTPVPICRMLLRLAQPGPRQDCTAVLGGRVHLLCGTPSAYGSTSTDMAYGARGSRCSRHALAMSGTELGYAATTR